jgi:hypothetical protein
MVILLVNLFINLKKNYFKTSLISHFSSTIIRDLTLRSAPSFGGFHLIRLLYDEYMFYLIEHKIAKSVNETSIAVMSDLSLMHGQNIDD